MALAANEDVYVVERILADDEVDGETFYLVKWDGYDDAQCTWEPADSFTSPKSIKEFRKQKTAGLSLPDEFLVALQNKMDDFQLRNQQNHGTTEQAHDDYDDVDSNDSEAAQPSKRQKMMDTTDTNAQALNPSQRTKTPNKKGIAKIIRSPAQRTAKSNTSTRTSVTTNIARVERSSTTMTRRPKPMSTSAQRAGQRFRNLSHMNNYRKKMRTELAPDISPAKLRSIADFDIGRENIRMLQPMVNQHRDESPLFIPDSNASELQTDSLARPDNVIFPPAKVDHQQHPHVAESTVATNSSNISRQRHNPVAVDRNTTSPRSVPLDSNILRQNGTMVVVDRSTILRHGVPHDRLTYHRLITGYPPNPKIKLDPRKARFFISFAQSNPAGAKAVQNWLEKNDVAPSSIYLDSERHDWIRFREKIEKIVSVLLFDEANLNYHQLPGLGQLLMAETPACFSLSFKRKHAIFEDMDTVRIKKLFPRMSMYLITESMITQSLEETKALVTYFDGSKKPGYKIMMRPNIERWLLEYTASETDDARRGTLIDLLLLIRNLRPAANDPTDIDGVEKLRSITGKATENPPDISYIISHSKIPGYNEAPPTTNSTFEPHSRDDVLKAYFYCYAAVKADETRRFFAFYTKKGADVHATVMQKKESEKTLDCGHVCFWELEKFVDKFCQQSEKRETHGNDIVVHASTKVIEESAEPIHEST